MGVQEREYLAERPIEPDSIAPEDSLGVVLNLSGTRIAQQTAAGKILKFACPAQDASGKWYRTTLAVSNVPWSDLCNILSNAGFVSQRLREIAKVGRVQACDLEILANRIDGLRSLVRDIDSGKQIDTSNLYVGANQHQPRAIEKNDDQDTTDSPSVPERPAEGP